MTYVQEIILDLNPNAAPPIVFMKQGDGESRQLHIFVTQDDEPYKLYHGAVLRIKKPDGNVTYTESLIPESDGSVYVTITAQSLAVSGRAYADLMLSDNEDNILSTLSFTLNIQPSPGGMDGIVSGSEYAVFSSMYGEAVNIINQAKSWAVGQTTGEGWGEAENNAKYYSEQAATIVAAFEENGIQLDAVASEPGRAPSVVSHGDGYFTLQAPVVNIQATGTAVSGDELGVTITVASVSDATAPQISQLQKKINFAFTFPDNGGGAASIDATLSSAGWAADAKVVGDRLISVNSSIGDLQALTTVIGEDPDEVTVISIAHGGTGASTSDGALTKLHAQPEMKIVSFPILQNDWNGTTVNITLTGDLVDASQFILSPVDAISWANAAEAMLYPPTLNNHVLTLTCAATPLGDITIGGYWW